MTVHCSVQQGGKAWEVLAVQQDDGEPYALKLNGGYDNDGDSKYRGLKNCGVFSLLFSPNGETFAVGIWAVLMRAEGTLAAGDENKSRPSRRVISWFEIWDADLNNKPERPRFRRPSSQPSLLPDGWAPGLFEFPQCADFSSDGRVFACSGLNGAIEIWDAVKYERLIVRHLHHRNSLGFVPVKISPDGKHFAASSQGQHDGTSGYDSVRVWAIDPVELRDPNFKSTFQDTSDVDSGMHNSKS